MANSQRRKGIEYEREVAAIWRKYGADVQDLQHNVAGLFDQLVTFPNCVLLSDPKRHETLRIPAWINQAEENFGAFFGLDASPEPRDAARLTWVIPFRQSGSRYHPPKSYVVMPLEDLARLLA